MLGQNNIEYVIVPPNCTDRLQPLDMSINKPVKDFLRRKFTDWYAEKIVAQKDGATANQPVDMKFNIMKPIGAEWMIEASDYIQSHSDMIKNGCKNSDILGFLKISQCTWLVL